MSVVSKNPFDLLGDDGGESPAPAAKAPAAAAAKKADAPAPARDVPGAAAKPAANANRGGRYPNRGGPRNVYRGDGGERNSGPTATEGVAEGAEHPGGFDGERVPPSRKGNHNHIRDAHTKGPRGTRPAKNYTSGGHTSSRGGGNSGAARTPAQGGERRQFERRSGGLPDSQKKVDQGWGANEGEAELNAEVQGEQDAVVEENTPQTPAPEADAAAEGETEQPAAEAEPAEPEEVQKSLDEYLAERAKEAMTFGKKEGRTVTADTLEGSEFRRAAIEEFFSNKQEKSTKTAKAPKKEKVFIEFDGQFATPPGGDRGGRGGRGGDRGGRGGGRGRGFGGEGRGAPRGARGGRGGAGGSRGGRAPSGIDANDTSAFPALGA